MSPRHDIVLAAPARTPFGDFGGSLRETPLTQLAVHAARACLARSGLEAGDIDGVFVGHYNGGFLPQDFTASLVAMAVPALRHVPAVRLENACATGSAAIHAALTAIAAKRIDFDTITRFFRLSQSCQVRLKASVEPSIPTASSCASSSSSKQNGEGLTM